MQKLLLSSIRLSPVKKTSNNPITKGRVAKTQHGLFLSFRKRFQQDQRIGHDDHKDTNRQKQLKLKRHHGLIGKDAEGIVNAVGEDTGN